LNVDVPLERRVFLVGPNASGKSNFLDAFRFLRDIADPQGGFQRAISQVRRGVSVVRSLHARKGNVVIEVEVDLDEDAWSYRLELSQDNQRRPVVQRELVTHRGETVLDRPDPDDALDVSRLTQTHLEQVSANKDFRPLQEFFARVRYLHLVPQLVREPERSAGRFRDPFGGDFLEQLAKTPKKTLDARLRRITEALRFAIPQLKKLDLEPDERGAPHLKGLYEHWRPKAGWQTEDQFSDGTLRLFGLLWVLLDGNAPLLLEEPELSLHPEVVRYIPSMMARLSRKVGRQILVSTHSETLLSDPGIAPEEVLVLEPTREDTKVRLASSDEAIRLLAEGGLPISEAVMPRTAPREARQLALFGE
jgi:predicted ATPase